MIRVKEMFVERCWWNGSIMSIIWPDSSFISTITVVTDRATHYWGCRKSLLPPFDTSKRRYTAVCLYGSYHWCLSLVTFKWTFSKLRIYEYVTLDHKISHKGPFCIDIYTSSESIPLMYALLGYDNIWTRYNYLKIWNLRVQKIIQNSMHITNQKCSFYIVLA